MNSINTGLRHKVNTIEMSEKGIAYFRSETDEVNANLDFIRHGIAVNQNLSNPLPFCITFTNFPSEYFAR